MYHIPHIPTAFSAKLIRLSAKTANILLLFTFPFYTITETPDFCMIVYFCLIVRFFPQSPSYQRHPKTKKLGSTTHRDEPHQALKPLDFNPFFNTFAYEYQKSYGIIWKLPPVPLLYFDDFYPSLPHLPHPIRHSTNRQNIKPYSTNQPLFFSLMQPLLYSSFPRLLHIFYRHQAIFSVLLTNPHSLVLAP